MHSLFLQNPILSFNSNTQGTDYFVGDIHGYLDSFVKGLELINFDFSKDRIFSVGDLIDRGPYNMECLKLTKEDWFFSVVGNHERILYDNLIQKLNVRSTETLWQGRLTKSERNEALALVESLSWAIQIDNIGVVHANIPRDMQWNELLN